MCDSDDVILLSITLICSTMKHLTKKKLGLKNINYRNVFEIWNLYTIILFLLIVLYCEQTIVKVFATIITLLIVLNILPNYLNLWLLIHILCTAITLSYLFILFYNKIDKTINDMCLVISETTYSMYMALLCISIHILSYRINLFIGFILC